MKSKSIYYQTGLYFCIASLIIITIGFFLLPLTTSHWSGHQNRPQYPILAALIIGISFVCLILLFLQEKVRLAIGAFGYFFLFLFISEIYINGFSTLYGIQWEIGMHLVMIGIILQFAGAFLVTSVMNINDKIIGWKIFELLIIFIGVIFVLLGILSIFSLVLVSFTIYNYTVINVIIVPFGLLFLFLGIISKRLRKKEKEMH